MFALVNPGETGVPATSAFSTPSPHQAMLKISLLAGLLLMSSSVALAQATPQPSATPSGATNKEEIVELSAFEVSSTANRGYVTTSSLTASRIAVPITELPSTVIVINEKLIQDTVAIDMRDTFNYISGANHGNQGTGSQEQNAISLRGYTVSTSQRDGITDRMITAQGGFDYSYIESIEVVKGPSGVLYGSHTPGGVINFVSKRPLLKPRTKISAVVGSYNTYRFEADTSGFLDRGRQWGYCIAGARADTDRPLDFPGEPSGGFKAINPSLSYRTKNGLHVWAWTAFVRDSTKRLAYSAHGYQTGPTTGRVLFQRGRAQPWQQHLPQLHCGGHRQLRGGREQDHRDRPAGRRCPAARPLVQAQVLRRSHARRGHGGRSLSRCPGQCAWHGFADDQPCRCGQQSRDDRAAANPVRQPSIWRTAPCTRRM